MVRIKIHSNGVPRASMIVSIPNKNKIDWQQQLSLNNFIYKKKKIKLHYLSKKKRKEKSNTTGIETNRIQSREINKILELDENDNC